MAESFAFEIAGQLLHKLSSLAFREIGQIWGVKSELQRLESTLSSIKAVLLDAAKQQATSEHVRDWLEKLQDVLYDADNVLDDFQTEDLRRKVVIKGSKRKEVSNFFSSSNSIVFRSTMSHKIKEIRERLEDISADKTNFHFIERDIDDTQIVRHYTWREQTHSFIRASDVIGRDLDKQRIVDLLLSSTFIENNLSVLPIVGLGGLGKTTLAKLVYNDHMIVSNFETRIWVCVSEDFDLKKLIEKIIKDATGDDKSHLDLNQLQTCVRGHLNSKHFLLVLDDVWNEDPKKWIDLRDLLNCGAQGSKIVVTTRSKTIATIMGTFKPYSLAGLSNDECMSVFVKCAFKEGQEKEYPKLVEIGKAIVSKCGGLPLAVRSLGSLLFTKTEEREWVYIRDNDIWKISQRENDILPILKLSYDQMPLRLKQCFAYCSRFAKDIKIYSYHLIYCWIAQGFIQSPDGSQRLEDIGNQYLNELISRSFFHDVEELYNCQVESIKIHDLVHDLAIFVAGKEVSHVKIDTMVNSERTRHLLFCENNLMGKEFPHFLCRLNMVQSFSFKFNVGLISKSFLDKLIKSFKCLRMLDLDGSDFEELPNSIGDLKHLRYVSLYKNKTIKSLPDSICNLLNLQYLDTSDCEKLQDFPRDFGNLLNLRYLTLTSQMTCLPEKGLEGLISLQDLTIQQCYNLESLFEGIRHLTALRKLCIDQCPSLTSLPGSMRYLTSLEDVWIGRCEKLSLLNLQGSLNTLVIWELPTLTEFPYGLQLAAATIKYLWIQDCPSFSSLPVWLNKCTSLAKMRVKNCRLLESLPLGMDQLTGLRYLEIAGCPDLSTKCETETGEYWPLIRHIPEICLQ